VIGDLIRPVWTWALWSWQRLAITVCLLCLLIAAATRAAHAPASHHRLGPHHAAPVRRARPAPAITGAALAAAIRAGREFATAWVSHRPGWATQVRWYATAGLAAQVRAGDHTYLPATAVTGPATAVRETAGSVTVLVPTNAGPAAVTVIRSGGRWLAAAVHLTRVGD
jgi:hypothetical protein